MKNYHEEKMNFHYKQWELAMDANKPNAAAQHMQDYLNYKEMNKMWLQLFKI